MKNLFKRIIDWFHDNYKYDGFVQMILWGCITLIILVCNICILSTACIDWLLSSLELIFTLWMAERWQNAKRLREYKDYAQGRINYAFNMWETAAAHLIEEHFRLVVANRRRKRAERALKKTRLALRKESSERLGFETKADEYEFWLLIAHCALVNDAPDRRDWFLAWMDKHPEIEKRQAKRQYIQSLYECLFFGDAKGEVKETYAGLFGSKEFGQQLFADVARGANAFFGNLLGIKEEESPSNENKENQQQ